MTEVYVIDWQDYIYLAIYIWSNLIKTGMFRVFMTIYRWKKYQIITLKFLLVMSTITYFIIGVKFVSNESSISE